MGNTLRTKRFDIHSFLISYLPIFFCCITQWAFSQASYQTYSGYTNATAIGAYNNDANFLINACVGDKAVYLWTDGEGKLLDAQSDFAGSCGQYRIDAETYIKTDATGSASNRDIRFQKLGRNGIVLLEKTYPQALDNFGQFVIPTQDGGFMIAGNTEVTTDSLYKMQLTKIDNNGTLQWQKTIDNPNLTHGKVRRPNPNSCYDVILNKMIPIYQMGQTSDGGYYINYSWDDPSTNCAFGYSRGFFIVRTDANGNFSWQKGRIQLQHLGIKTFPAENGSLYVSESQMIGSARTFTGYIYNLKKLSPNGDTLWSYVREAADGLLLNNYMYSLALMANNDVIAHMSERVIEGADPISKNLIRVFESNTGEVVNSVNLTQFIASKAILPTQDSGFVLTGNIGTDSIFFYKDKFTPSILQPGMPILVLKNVIGDTLVRQGSSVKLNVTIYNEGTTPSDPNTPLSIFQQRDLCCGKGPQPICFSLVSNYVPIGRAIQPNETVTLTYTFTVDTNFTHLSPIVYPNVNYGSTNVTIGNRNKSYCDNIFSSTFNRDTLYRYHSIKADLDKSDLMLELLATDTSFTEEGIFDFTLKVTNKGNSSIKEAKTRFLNYPSRGNTMTTTPQKGFVNAGFFFGEYPYVWTIPILEVGETVSAKVRFQSKEMAGFTNSIYLSANVGSNQIEETNAFNNNQSQIFTRITAPLPDLTLENLTIPTPSVLKGQILNWKIDIKNISNANSGNTFNIKSYLSKDAYLSTDDYQDGIIPTGNYPPNFTQNQIAGAMTVNNTVPTGEYYLILKIDGDDEVIESNENNNILVSYNLITVKEVVIGGNADIALNLFVTPAVYRQWAVNTFRLFAQNNNNQVVTNIKVQFKFPEKTVNGGKVIPSVGNWREYCAGNIQCYEWTIPTLAANEMATLDVPLFILDAVGNITATATLLTSTPSDNILFNNTATIVLPPSSVASQALMRDSESKSTQYIPVIIQKITPNPTEGEVIVALESIVEKDVVFSVYNGQGKHIKNEVRSVKKGQNLIPFNLNDALDGLYFIQTSDGQGRAVPIKIVKF